MLNFLVGLAVFLAIFLLFVTILEIHERVTSLDQLLRGIISMMFLIAAFAAWVFICHTIGKFIVGYAIKN